MKILAVLLAGLSMVSIPVFGGSNSSNHSPVITSISKQYILEGDSLNLSVLANDLDGDQLMIGVTSRPLGSVFHDNHDGTAEFSWVPDYSGPNSSEGSPFIIAFWASDGQASSGMEVEVVVINNNRKPLIDPMDSIVFTAGEEVSFNLTGYDPDNDSINWSLLSAPENMIFDDDSRGQVIWQTLYEDSGFYNIEVILIDQNGAADTSDISLEIRAAMVYSLSIDTVSGYPGELVTLDINILNLEDVSGFNILFSYDISVLNLSLISNEGTRTEHFEYFSYRIDHNNMIGDILITAIADFDGGAMIENLAAGDGPVASTKFYLTNDYSFAGYLIPVRFVFRDQFLKLDNTFSDSNGDVIGQDAISYFDGSIKVRATDYSSLGDININGVSFEISDAIYFTNYFIDPGKFPLSPEQRANSDVNLDGMTATIADLVFLINRIVSLDGGQGKLGYSGYPVNIISDFSTEIFSLRYNSDIELGGIAVTLESDEKLSPNIRLTSEMEVLGMQVKSSVDNNLIRLVIYSDEGLTMSSGINEFFSVESGKGLKIRDIQLSSVDGSLLKAIIKDGNETNLPHQFLLYQNYPNPFNPTTDILFDLPYSTSAELMVFNILGREVRSLVDAVLPAGKHSIRWDGRDNSGISVSSGIYFYKLKSDNFSAIKKMILLK